MLHYRAGIEGGARNPASRAGRRSPLGRLASRRSLVAGLVAAFATLALPAWSLPQDNLTDELAGYELWKSPNGLIATDGPAPPGQALPAPPALAGQLLRRELYGAALGRAVPYDVYLPPDYGASGRRYPVLYMLHGINGSCEAWPAMGLPEMADAFIVQGVIQPLIVVMPEGEKGYWLNHADGGPRWGDYLIDDVVPSVDVTYRTIPTRENRAIGGNSMGGHGALQTAFNHPELFGVVGAHSPGLRPYSDTFAFFGDPSYFAQHDPMTLARTSDAPRRLAIWIDAGDEDPWRARDGELHDVLVSRGIAHEWHPGKGKHERAYWHEHVPEYLRFYARALAGAR